MASMIRQRVTRVVTKYTYRGAVWFSCCNRWGAMHEMGQALGSYATEVRMALQAAATRAGREGPTAFMVKTVSLEG